MKLKRIKINKFRSIEYCDIPISDVTAIVGENNSGKSSILRALNVFFNFRDERQAFKEKRHQYTKRSFSRIELVFHEVDADNVLARIIHKNQITVRLTYNPIRNIETFEYKKRKYHQLKIKILNKIKQYLHFTFIPPKRDHHDLELEEKALIAHIINSSLSKFTRERDTLTPKFKEAAKYLERTALKKTTTELTHFLMAQPNHSYDLSFPDDINYKDFLDRIKFRIVEGTEKYNFADCGTGTQSLTVIALHRFLANLKKRNVIICIEEPESNLHPQSQRRWINEYLTHQTNSPDDQLILTTHSPTIIDSLDHINIVLFRKINDDHRFFKAKVNSLEHDFWSRNDIDEFRYYQFHKFKNSDFFFSKFVVIVESKVDAQVVHELLKQRNINLIDKGVSVVSLDGVENLKYLYHLVKEMGLEYIVVLDKDYFLPYINGELEKSRGSDGYPRHTYAYKNSSLIDTLIPKTSDRSKLLKLFKSNHSKALDILERYNIICFSYCLEIDLVRSKTASNIFYSILNIPLQDQNSNELLVNRKNQIKKVKNLLAVIRGTPHRNLPNSYKRIKNVIQGMVKKYCG